LFAALTVEDGEGAGLNGHADENGVEEEEEASAAKPKKGKKKGAANAASLFAALQEDGEYMGRHRHNQGWQ
jgi:hypothetical protein